jgi:hypothetical protein
MAPHGRTSTEWGGQAHKAGPGLRGSPHPCRTYGGARPAERLDSTALSRRSLIRMRSQVQVLAGPPHIPAGHSAVGSEPGAAAASLGRAGAAHLSPSARPIGPFRPPPTGRQAPRRPRTVVAHPALVGSYAAGAATSHRQPVPVPSRRQPPALRTPAWPAWSLCGYAAARTQPGPGRPPTSRLPNARPRQRRPPGLLGRRPSHPTARPPIGTSTPTLW